MLDARCVGIKPGPPMIMADVPLACPRVEVFPKQLFWMGTVQPHPQVTGFAPLFPIGTDRRHVSWPVLINND